MIINLNKCAKNTSEATSSSKTEQSIELQFSVDTSLNKLFILTILAISNG